MRFVITLIFAFAACIVNAQDILTELAKDFPGQGKVVINQSSSVAALVGCQTSTSSKDGKSIKTIGYRVQLYAGGNSRDARSEAYNIAEKAQSNDEGIKHFGRFQEYGYCEVTHYYKNRRIKGCRRILSFQKK